MTKLVKLSNRFLPNSMWILQGFHLEFGGIQVEFTKVLVGLGSRWIQVNLVGMVGIWWEFGWNYSHSRLNLGGFSLT